MSSHDLVCDLMILQPVLVVGNTKSYMNVYKPFTTKCKVFMHNTVCNTLRGRINGNFCATNEMLHSKLLLWNAVMSCQHT